MPKIASAWIAKTASEWFHDSQKDTYSYQVFQSFEPFHIFSYSVAAGTSTMVPLEVSPEEASETAFSVEHMDQLFNVFSKFSSQTMSHANWETSGHVEFLY